MNLILYVQQSSRILYLTFDKNNNMIDRENEEDPLLGLFW